MPSWFLNNAERTRAAGAALARVIAALSLDKPLIVTLSGELGAGKTTLVGGFLNALGVAGPVRSPTYTLMEPYEFASLMVWHLDLYRLTDPLQLEDLGLRDQLQPRTVVLVEWADRGGDFFAHPDLKISLAYAAQGGVEGRELRIEAAASAMAELIHRLSF